MTIVVHTSPENHLVLIYGLFENSHQMEINLSTTTSHLVEKIVSLTQQYSVKKIIFRSPQAWGDYFIKDIQKHDSAKFINFMIEEG